MIAFILQWFFVCSYARIRFGLYYNSHSKFNTQPFSTSCTHQRLILNALKFYMMSLFHSSHFVDLFILSLRNINLYYWYADTFQAEKLKRVFISVLFPISMKYLLFCFFDKDHKWFFHLFELSSPCDASPHSKLMRPRARPPKRKHT